MTKRQFPNPRDLLGLMQFKKPELDRKKRRLGAALTTSDLRAIAKRRTLPHPTNYAASTPARTSTNQTSRDLRKFDEQHWRISLSSVSEAGLLALASPPRTGRP